MRHRQSPGKDAAEGSLDHLYPRIERGHVDGRVRGAATSSPASLGPIPLPLTGFRGAFPILETHCCRDSGISRRTTPCLRSRQASPLELLLIDDELLRPFGGETSPRRGSAGRRLRDCETTPELIVIEVSDPSLEVM